jgi:hypothetical protein
MEGFGRNNQNVARNITQKALFFEGQNAVALRAVNNFQIRVSMRGDEVGFGLFSDIGQGRHKGLPPDSFLIILIILFFICG